MSATMMRVGSGLLRSGGASVFTKPDYLAGGIVSVADRSLTEGNSGSSNMTFTVLLSGAQSAAVKFDYLTIDGTATAGVDYTSTSGTKTIPTGATSVTVDVPILGDTNVESDETFTFRVRNPRFV